MSAKAASFPVRVYYEDTDAAGIVYYANYLKFAERARTEALRGAGFDQSILLRDHKFGFVVRKCTADFLKPAMLDDHLTIETRLTDISRVSLTMQQTIFCNDDVLVKLDIKLAVVGDGMKPVKLPDPLSEAIKRTFNYT